MVYTVENILSKNALGNLYNNLLNNNVWCLSRTSNYNPLGTFPGFVVQEENNIYNQGWSGYFLSLLENNRFEDTSMLAAISAVKTYLLDLQNKICMITNTMKILILLIHICSIMDLFDFR